MLVLNSLPNVQILNGRSTKDDDDEEEEENNENDDVDTNNNRNNHLYPQMEEIEEDKNMENNSNYVSNENNNNTNSKENNVYGTDNRDRMNGNNNNNDQTEKETVNVYKEKVTITKTVNVIDGKEYTDQNVEITKEGNNQPNTLLYDKIVSDNSKKNFLPEANNLETNNNNMNNPNNPNNQNNNYDNATNNKKNESFYDLKNINTNSNDNKNNGNYLIDITNEELNLLKDEKYHQNSDFVSILKEYADIFYSEETERNRIPNIYLSKFQKVEEKKGNIPNYYYFYLLYKKKIKVLKGLFDELFPYILNKCPEINTKNILIKLNNEFVNTIKDSKDLISAMHNHIEEFNNNKKNANNPNENKNNNNNNEQINNLNEIIKDQNNKIASLESQKEQLLKDINDDKKTYEKKIASLENENKIMTQKLLNKANNFMNDPHETINTIDRSPKINNYGAKPINNRNHGPTPIKSRDNSSYDNKNKRNLNNMSNNNKTRSPNKSYDNTITLDNYNNTINYLNTNNNVNNTNKHQLISLKSLKDFINELYASKENYDMKCIEFKLPKETLEEHMYTFLNKKYGLKNLIIDWARNVINGIKYYSKKDSFVLLFGKIMRNEQEEDARLIIKKVSESIEELLLYYIKRQNPLKSVNEIKRIFDRKKKSELFEEEWKGIIFSIYEKNEADEIEKKIENFINKENEKKKIEMFKKYKDSRINNNNHNKQNSSFVNNTNVSNNYNLNTINSYNNGINSTLSPNNNNNMPYMNTINNTKDNKLSRVEKYSMLLFPDDKNILFSDFIKIVLDNHIRFRDKQLKNFVELFRSVDTNKDGIINEEEFSELIQRMKIFKEDEVENRIFQYLEKIDPFDNQKITFSECVSFFSGEIIKDSDANGNEKEISVLEKVCFNGDKNGNGHMGYNINELNENEQIERNMEINNISINKNDNNNDDIGTIEK